ncbi:MAG: hypothetical protein IPN86_15905 [Saprospiraceae bacterium]|nr:hypothetical protein [Saprospiraceae bacterium]
MVEIKIFTAPIRSGKTTALMSLFAKRKDTTGFLCPDVDGLRHFYDLSNALLLPFEAEERAVDCEDLVAIGRFRFKKEIFIQAEVILMNALTSKYKFIVIDEVGKLELMGNGYEPMFGKFLVAIRALDIDCIVILVVRDYLLDQVIERYSLSDACVIQLANFKGLDDFSKEI